MSTATVTGHPSGEPLADPGERGRLEVSTRAVERIAQQVAVLTPGIGGGGRRVLGVQVSEASSDARPRVSAAVAWPVARLHVEVAVEYPHPIVPTVAELRRRLADEVARQAGVEVQHVSVTVIDLVRSGPHAREVL